MHTADIIVIGGGIVGTSVGYGLAQRGCDVVLIDQGDLRHRASVGNFGLVWVQGKGAGHRPYTEWTLEASERYPAFAARIQEETGIDLCYRRTGGVELSYGPDAYAERSKLVARLKAEAGTRGYNCEMLSHQEVQAMVPKLPLGEAIAGGSYSPLDGHLNPLYLLQGLTAGFYNAGGRHFPGQTAMDIETSRGEFSVRTDRDRFAAPGLVIAAGLGIPPLAERIGLTVPVSPQRGQLLVSERVRPVLDIPLGSIRQTGEGSFLIGLSAEKVGFDLGTTLDVQRGMARRAIEAFPSLAGLRMVRSWAALRVLTPDIMPIYHRSENYPGAYVVTSHSGVTLAPMHAYHIANWIMDDHPHDGMAAFSLRRFNVQEIA